MTFTVDIPKEIKARLFAEAQARGVPLPDFLRDILIDHYDDSEDCRVAESRLSNPQPPISSSQLRKNLGLDN